MFEHGSSTTMASESDAIVSVLFSLTCGSAQASGLRSSSGAFPADVPAFSIIAAGWSIPPIGQAQFAAQASDRTRT